MLDADESRLQLLPLIGGHVALSSEQIWLRLKDKVATNRLYGSMPHLPKTAADFFAHYDTPARTRLGGHGN